MSLGDSKDRKWLPKPEILISLRLWDITWKFQRQIRHFRLCRAHESVGCEWFRQRTITGNGNAAAKTGNTYIFGTVTYTTEIPKANLGLYDPTRRNAKLWSGDCDDEQPEMEIWMFWTLSCHFRLSVVAAIISLQFYHVRHGVADNAGFAVGILMLWRLKVNAACI